MPTAPEPSTGLGTVQRRMADPSEEKESGHSFSVPQVHDTKPRTTQRATRGLKTTWCLYFRPAQDRCPLAFYPEVWWPAVPCSGQRHYCRASGKKTEPVLALEPPSVLSPVAGKTPSESFAKLLQPCSPESARLNTFRRALYWVICDSLSGRAGP